MKSKLIQYSSGSEFESDEPVVNKTIITIIATPKIIVRATFFLLLFLRFRTGCCSMFY
jgi:hypothetical protein